MKKHSSSFGAMHPALFFCGMYVVALFFSLFICSSIYHARESAKNANAASAGVYVALGK